MVHLFITRLQNCVKTAAWLLIALCSLVINGIETEPTSVDEAQPPAMVVDLFPNPANDIIHIDLQERSLDGITVSLVNATRQSVLRKQFVAGGSTSAGCHWADSRSLCGGVLRCERSASGINAGTDRPLIKSKIEQGQPPQVG